MSHDYFISYTADVLQIVIEVQCEPDVVEQEESPPSPPWMVSTRELYLIGTV